MRCRKIVKYRLDGKDTETVHQETIMQHTRHTSMAVQIYKPWQAGSVLTLQHGSTAITKSLHFLLQLGFVGADELVDLLAVFEEEERRGCADVPC